MKAKLWKRIFYPFEHNTSNALLVVGILGYLGLSLLGSQWNFISDGIIQMHGSKPRALWQVLINNAINSLSLSVLLFLLARLVYSKTRYIDVLTVVLISQLCLLINGLLLFNPAQQAAQKDLIPIILKGDFTLNEIQVNQFVWMTILGILALVFIFYFFVLLIQGMKIAMNSKKGYHAVFIIVFTLLLDIILWIVRPYLG